MKRPYRPGVGRQRLVARIPSESRETVVVPTLAFAGVTWVYCQCCRLIAGGLISSVSSEP